MSILPMMPNFEVRKFVNPVKDDDSSFVTELIVPAPATGLVLVNDDKSPADTLELIPPPM